MRSKKIMNLKPVLENIMVEKGVMEMEKTQFPEDFPQQVAEYCDWDKEKIFALCIDLLRESNHNTDAKYLARLFNDILDAGQIEDTAFYSSGLV